MFRIRNICKTEGEKRGIFHIETEPGTSEQQGQVTDTSEDDDPSHPGEHIRSEGHGRRLNLELDLAPLSFRVTEVGLPQGFLGKEKGPTCCLFRS